MKVACVLIVLIASGVAFGSGVALPFADGFEIYAVGSAPSPPWERHYNAASIVTDEQAFDGGQSYKLTSAVGWSDSASVDVVFPDAFSYEVACRVQSGKAGAGQFEYDGGMVYNHNDVWFNDGGYITFHGTQVTPCALDTWYRVVVAIVGFCGEDATADVVVYDAGGSELGALHGVPAETMDDVNQCQFVLHTGSAEVGVAYFDSVSIAPAVGLPGTLIPLDPGWNMIGDTCPDGQPHRIGACRILACCGAYSWDDSVSGGMVQGTVYAYQPGAGYLVLGADDWFTEGRGYWVLNSSGRMLLLHVPYLELVGTYRPMWETEGTALGADVVCPVGDTVYLAASVLGDSPAHVEIEVVDTTNPSAPAWSCDVQTGGSSPNDLPTRIDDMEVLGDRLFSSPGCLRVAALTLVPPAVCGGYDDFVPYSVRYLGMDVQGDYLYAADHWGPLNVFSISTPCSPALVHAVGLSGYPHDVVARGDVAFAISTNTLSVLDIADPGTASVVCSSATGGKVSRLALNGDYAYVGTWDPPGVDVFDISAPCDPAPVLERSVPTSAAVSGLASADGLLFVAVPDCGLDVFDVSDPADPRFVMTYDTPGRPVHVAVQGRYVYVADEAAGMLIISW